MKLRSNLNGKREITNNFSSDRKKKKKYFKYNITLLLKKEKEKEKANSTTQTGQKSLIFSNDDNNPKYLYKTFNFNTERRKSKNNSNLFLLNDKLFSKNEVNGKLFFHYENEDDNNKNKETKININNRKIYRLTKLSLIDICYNSLFNKNDEYLQKKNNNIDMYHYNDLNQRKIERIIPNINEYLDNNSNKKKDFQKNIIKSNKNKVKNLLIQNTFNKINHKQYSDKNKKFNNVLYNNKKK